MVKKSIPHLANPDGHSFPTNSAYEIFHTGLRMCNQLAQNHDGMGITWEFFCGLGPRVGFPLAVLLCENALVLLGKSVIPPIFVYNCERRAIASIGAEPFVLNCVKEWPVDRASKLFRIERFSVHFGTHFS